MKLANFSVERFRSIIHRSSFRIFDRTIIIGPNNEGKSNILRALVIALKILSAIAESPKMIKREGKTLIYTPTLLGRRDNYSWMRDYPIGLQNTRGKKSNKRSIFTLNFELDNSEFESFRHLTGTNLKHKQIPIRLEVSDDDIAFTLNIPGHFYKNASEAKMFKIAQFITEKINICYIDAVRNASTASQSISSLLSIEIKRIYDKPEYKRLLRELKTLHAPILNEMSKKVNESLQQFVPNIKTTNINLIDNDSRQLRLFSQFEVEVDDGVNTPLSQKGSGVQSLVALSLAQYISLNSGESDNFILAIEEPESHLHPDAIHEIRNVLLRISQHNQLIITTHSPLFAETGNPHMNIIVRDNAAQEAVKIADIRKVLGVSPADNLISAELVLIVEGASDENMLPHILSLSSPLLKNALEQKRLVISSTGGTHHMESYTRFILHNLCRIHVCVDDDEAGRQIIESMLAKTIIPSSGYTKFTIAGMHQSEIEDIFDPSSYAAAISEKYGVSKDDICTLHSTHAKWSVRMKNIFERSGKIWDEDAVKTLVAETIKNTPVSPILQYRRASFDSLCHTLENQLS